MANLASMQLWRYPEVRLAGNGAEEEIRLDTERSHPP